MTPSTQNLASKATLARLMAAENLKVDINSKAPTASFNMVERVLTLPVWDVADEAYNMLVGHEVSHALFTPGGTALSEACDSISKKHRMVAKDYINVVEDARIERLIKAEYPGLRRSFAEGYREFIKRDLFKVTGKDISSLPLIDRVNLQYKIGWTTTIPFSAEELPLVQRVATTQNWDEVVALSKELYEFAKQQEQEQQPEEQDGEEGESSGEEGEEEESQSEGQECEEGEEGQEGEESSDGEEGEGEEGEEGDEDGSSEDDSEGEESDSEEGDEEEGSTESESEGEGEEEGDEDAEQGEMSEDEGDAPSRASTAEALEEALKELAAAAASETYRTYDLPVPSKGMVTPSSKFHETVERVATSVSASDLPAKFFTTWKGEESANIQTLWTEFERRKAADAYERTMVAETGIIDPIRVGHYRVTDDIFMSDTVVRSGKNHGLFILLDMSASMRNKIVPTMIQLVNLATFARRANIPYSIYGYVSDVGYGSEFFGHESSGFIGKGWENVGANNVEQSTGLVNPEKAPSWYHFRLVTLLESGQSLMAFNRQVGNLLYWAASMSEVGLPETYKSIKGRYYDSYTAFCGTGLRLANTPTTTALMASLTTAAEFKARHRLQVVNTVVLSDGESNDSPLTTFTREKGTDGFYRDTLPILRDPVTKREYRAYKPGEGMAKHQTLTRREQQALMAQILRERIGGNVMMVSLAVDSGNVKWALGMVNLKQAEFEKAYGEYKKNRWVMLANAKGYNRIAIMDVGNGREDDSGYENWELTDEDLTSKRALNKLSKAFIKNLESKKTNRPLMAKIAEVMAANLK